MKRREFLAGFPPALGLAVLPAWVWPQQGDRYEGNAQQSTCWLDVCAPFVVEDRELGIHTEIILTSDTFSGVNGHYSASNATEFEIYLFDASGRVIGTKGVTKRLTVPAMNTTALPVKDLIGDSDFIGGVKVRLRPQTRIPMHASDLFSSAFIRITSNGSFDNVHANPDPLEWQRAEGFFYSMPFPPLAVYDCVYSLFNPYPQTSSGEITLSDPLGRPFKTVSYEAAPQSSLFLHLESGGWIRDVKEIFGPGRTRRAKQLTDRGGTISVINRQSSVKNFGYLLIQRRDNKRFSIDHPIHQKPFEADVAGGPAPFDNTGRFKAKNVLHTPLLFNSKRLGGITLDTRFHLSSGLPIEKSLWLSPYVTDKDGTVVWPSAENSDLKKLIPPGQIERGVIELGARESCIVDCADIGLPSDFAGGLSLPISPTSNHTLMKVEIRVREWQCHAFTHFRPGLSSARGYQKAAERGGLATDYVTSGARLERFGEKVTRDEIVAIQNIDDQGVHGKPVLEIFGPTGFVTRIQLPTIVGFAAVHHLLSDLVKGDIPGDLTLRLVDTDATLLMSVVHIDHQRRDLALDHGSDRFSTFRDFDCDPAK